MAARGTYPPSRASCAGPPTLTTAAALWLESQFDVKAVDTPTAPDVTPDVSEVGLCHTFCLVSHLLAYTQEAWGLDGEGTKHKDTQSHMTHDLVI